MISSFLGVYPTAEHKTWINLLQKHVPFQAWLAVFYSRKLFKYFSITFLWSYTFDFQREIYNSLSFFPSASGCRNGVICLTLVVWNYLGEFRDNVQVQSLGGPLSTVAPRYIAGAMCHQFPLPPPVSINHPPDPAHVSSPPGHSVCEGGLRGRAGHCLPCNVSLRQEAACQIQIKNPVPEHQSIMIE